MSPFSDSPWLARLWVTLTLLLISFLGFSSQLFIVLPSYSRGLSDPECVKLLVVFNALLGGLYGNYWLTVRTDPGRVPRGWEPDWKLMETGEMEVKKQSGGPRFCRTCKEYKPPRAHHCRQCKRCVLKMDHHCPWVNNCVGHFNYGHFCRFLFFVDAACSFHLYMVTKRAFGSFSFFQTHPSTTQMVILVANYVLCVPVLIAVGVFSLFHFWSIITNTTTIEGWEKDKVASLKRRGKIREYRYPYNLGVLPNLRAVLGDSILLWCWPQRSPGTGLSYPTGTGSSKPYYRHERRRWFWKRWWRRLGRRAKGKGEKEECSDSGCDCDESETEGEADRVGSDLRDQLTWPPRDEHVPLRRKARPPPPGTAFTAGNTLLRSTSSSTASLVFSTAAETSVRRRNRPRAAPRPPWQDGEVSDEDAGASEEDEDDVPLGTLAARQQLVCLGGEAGAVEEDEENDRLPSRSVAEARAQAGRLSREHDELDEDEGKEMEEEDDIDPDRSVRIRRGSEGYEIRPRRPSPPPPPSHPRDGSTSSAAGGLSDDGSWELAGGVEYDSQEEEDEPEVEVEEESEYEVDEEGDRRRLGARYKYYVREEDSESDLESLRSVSEGEEGEEAKETRV